MRYLAGLRQFAEHMERLRSTQRQCYNIAYHRYFRRWKIATSDFGMTNMTSFHLLPKIVEIMPTKNDIKDRELM